jgi:hypothetical protein
MRLPFSRERRVAPRPVNFLHKSSPNYDQVQNQLFDLVRAQLPEGTARDTTDVRDDEAVNLGFHIRWGRGKNSWPLPLDVIMSHGLADKSYLLAQDVRTGHRLLNSYEHVLVPGQWFKDRLLRRRFHPDPRKRVTLGADRIHVVGWPRLDPLYAEPRAPRPVTDRPLRVLWAPSHDLSRPGPDKRPFSSYPAFEEHLPALQAEFDVRVSLHPSNRTDKSPTTGALTWADVVVSDHGTMLYEAWALGKCVVMPTWLMPETMTRDPKFKRNAEGHIYRRRIGNHASSIDELMEMVRADEPPGRDVAEFMAQILEPGTRGRSAAIIAGLLPTLPLHRLGD